LHDRREINSDFTNGEGSAVRRGGPAGRGTRQGWLESESCSLNVPHDPERASERTEWTDRQTDRWTDRQTDRHMNEQINSEIKNFFFQFFFLILQNAAVNLAN